MMPNLSVGDEVVLVTPDNPRLHGMRVKVTEMTAWGAFVSTSVGTGQFRAAWEEMGPVGQSVNGVAPKMPSAKDQGYTGDVCQICGSLRMKRNGACLLCEDCGSTSGCS